MSQKDCPTAAQVRAAKAVLKKVDECKAAPKKAASKKKKASAKKTVSKKKKASAKKTVSKKKKASAKKPAPETKKFKHSDGAEGTRPSARAWYDNGKPVCTRTRYGGKTKCLKLKSNGSPFFGSCEDC